METGSDSPLMFLWWCSTRCLDLILIGMPLMSLIWLCYVMLCYVLLWSLDCNVGDNCILYSSISSGISKDEMSGAGRSNCRDTNAEIVYLIGQNWKLGG
jgi:hypothetical protein